MIWHVLFIMMVAAYEFLRHRQAKVDLLTCFNISFVISYPLAALVLARPDHPSPYPVFIDPLAMLAIPAYTCFWGIFVLAHQAPQRSGKARTPSPPGSSATQDRRILRRLLLLLAFSAALVLAYSSEYGGVEQAIRLAGGLRAGFVERGELSFLKRLLPLPAICAHVAFAYVLASHRKPRFILPVFLAFLLLAIAGLLMMAGRARIIFFIIGLLFIYIFMRRRLPKTGLLVAGVLGVAILLYGKVYFSILANRPSSSPGEVLRESMARQSTGGPTDLAGLLVAETSHFYVSLEAAVLDANSPESFRFYHDIPVAVVDLLPQAILPFSLPEKVAYLNTMRVLGVWESIVPPGLVAYSLMNMGILGLLFTPALLGAFTGRLESFLLAHLHASPVVATAYSVYLLLFGYDILQGEPSNFIGGSFVRLVFLGFVMWHWRRSGAENMRVGLDRTQLQPHPASGPAASSAVSRSSVSQVER